MESEFLKSVTTLKFVFEFVDVIFLVLSFSCWGLFFCTTINAHPGTVGPLGIKSLIDNAYLVD